MRKEREKRSHSDLRQSVFEDLQLHLRVCSLGHYCLPCLGIARVSRPANASRLRHN